MCVCRGCRAQGVIAVGIRAEQGVHEGEFTGKRQPDQIANLPVMQPPEGGRDDAWGFNTSLHPGFTPDQLLQKGLEEEYGTAIFKPPWVIFR